MPLISTSFDIFLVTSSAIIAPYIWYLFRATKSPSRRLLDVLVLLHTLYILHTILLNHPPNVFSSFGISLTTSNDKIRAALIARAGGEKLPENIQDLLTKLGSFEVRT